MRHLKGHSFRELIGEIIVDSHHSCDLMPKCGSYGATTLMAESGREFVIWNSMGEINLSEVIDD